MAPLKPWTKILVTAALFAITLTSQRHYAACLQNGTVLSGIVVSVTTVPGRLESLGPTLTSLMEQTHKVQIVVAIPHKSHRFPDKQYSVPQWIVETDDILIIRGKDWGPATKLLAPLEHMQRDSDDIIITVDDDTVYHPRMVENLLAYAAEFPDSALAHAGHRLFGPPIRMHDFESVQFLRPPHHQRFYGQPVPEPVVADVLHGYAGALYRPRFFDDGIMDYAGMGDAGAAAFFVDDDWISCHLGRNGVPIVVVPSPEPLLARLPETQDSALNEGHDKIVRQIARQTLLLSACAAAGWITLRDPSSKPTRPNRIPAAEVMQWSSTCPSPALLNGRGSFLRLAALRHFQSRARWTAGGEWNVGRARGEGGGAGDGEEGARGDGAVGRLTGIVLPRSGTWLSCSPTVEAVTVRVRVELPAERDDEVVEVQVGDVVLYSASYRWLRQTVPGGELLLRAPVRGAGEESFSAGGNEAAVLRVEVKVAGAVVDAGEVVVETQGEGHAGGTGRGRGGAGLCEMLFGVLVPEDRGDWFLPDGEGAYATEEGAGGVLGVLAAMVQDALGGSGGGEGGRAGQGRGGEEGVGGMGGVRRGGGVRFVSLGAGGELWKAMEGRGWEGETVGGQAEEWEDGRVSWTAGELEGEGGVDVLWVDVGGSEAYAWARKGGGLAAAVVGVRFNPLLPGDQDWVAATAHGGQLEGREESVWSGASLLAMVRVGAALGYGLVHVAHREGVAFFVRSGLLGQMKASGREVGDGVGAVEEMLQMARIVACADGDPWVHPWVSSTDVLERTKAERGPEERRHLHVQEGEQAGGHCVAEGG